MELCGYTERTTELFDGDWKTKDTVLFTTFIHSFRDLNIRYIGWYDCQCPACDNLKKTMPLHSMRQSAIEGTTATDIQKTLCCLLGLGELSDFDLERFWPRVEAARELLYFKHFQLPLLSTRGVYNGACNSILGNHSFRSVLYAVFLWAFTTRGYGQSI